MRYFHRTTVTPDEVLSVADTFLAQELPATSSGPRQRVFTSGLGRLTVSVQAEGGHYTLVTVTTDQVGESELDKIAKRYLTNVHQRAEPAHAARGAY